MLKSEILKKLVSIVVLFSFLLTSCGNGKKRREAPGTDPLRLKQDVEQDVTRDACVTNEYSKVAAYYDDIAFEVGTTGQARCEAAKNKVAEEERTLNL